ncbi:oxidoreductase [Paenibacillus marinisediminis]
MYETFLSPIQIGNVTLKNRSVMTAMGTGYAELGGYVGDRLIAYHIERAKGGIGMNTVGISPVHETSAGPKYVGSYDDKFIPGLTKLAEAIKDNGGVACISLQHFGRQMSSKNSGLPLLAPSPIPCSLYQEMPKEMTLQDIQMIVEAFGDAALRAKKAGFDVIELHGAHGYLIGSFLSPFSNKRTDEYGGSLYNRMRFAIEVLANVRSKVGEDFPIMMSISGEEHVEGGLHLDETIKMAKILEGAGIAALNVTQGNHDAFGYEAPNTYMPEQTHVEVAAAIKKHLNIPVLVGGRITTPDMAEAILQEGKADIISFGRVLLADPHFVNKAIDGRANEIIRCVACNKGCITRMFSGESEPSCMFNPATGREVEYQLIPAEKKKHVLVIGGGPAGLEAARTMQERGHIVTLFEKTGGLGGQLVLAGASPHKRAFKDAAFSLGFRAYKSGIDIQMFTSANADNIKALNPDEIVIATGSEPISLEIPGIRDSNVYKARDVLYGDAFVKEQGVVIIGGGTVGIETAEVMAASGKKVVIIEITNEIGKGIGFHTKPYVMKSLRDADVDIYTEAKCIALEKGRLVIEHDGYTEIVPGIEAAILAVGSKSDDSLVEMVKATHIPYHIIGDAHQTGDALAAIWAGADLGRMI